MIYRLSILCFLISGCSIYTQDLPMSSCAKESNSELIYSKATAVRDALQELTRSGVPGASVAIYSDEGWWTAAAGVAKIESGTVLQPCHIMQLGSVAKTYTAVAILKLYEEGKLSLDEKVSVYLSEKYHHYISGLERITVRMLLNHTSGIPEYNFAPPYVSYLLQHPDHTFSTEDYLSFVKGKPLDFEPGSRYSYRNTNYVLLALILDKITGDHARFINDIIFKTLNLTQTFNRHTPDFLNNPLLVNGYWDRYSDGILENCTKMQNVNVASLIGDDGIVATPENAVRFLMGLMQGQLISGATLAEMKTWAKNSKGEPTYGLGLDYVVIQGEVAYGHSGGGLGLGCELYYFPEKNIYAFIGINLGTVTDSPLHVKAGEARNKLWDAILK